MCIKWFTFVVVLLDFVVSSPVLLETLVQNQRTDGLLNVKSSVNNNEIEDRMYHWTIDDLDELCRMWSDGGIYYSNYTDIDADVWSAIDRAMKLISSLTCVTFEDIGDNPFHSYVRIKQTEGFDCYSSPGRRCSGESANQLRLSNKCSPLFGHALRGWLKTIGMHPEHLRHDRDDYITIVNKNIPESMLYLFKKHNNSLHEKYYEEYDYCSVTHYSSNEWSKREEDTMIITSDPSYQSVIGQMEGLSYGDVKFINKLYACSSSCEKGLSCTDNCYLNEHCKCYCPKKLSPGECELYTAVDQGPTEEQPLKNGVVQTTIRTSNLEVSQTITDEPLNIKSSVNNNEIEDRMYHWSVDDLDELCRMWSDGTIYYSNYTDIDADVWSAIERAMKLISSLTCVKFHDIGDNPFHSYVRIKQTEGFDCYSSPGRRCSGESANQLRLSSKCSPLFGHALRGWLKTIGMHPEHLRHDRDDYITILKENIPESLLYLLTKHNNTLHEKYFEEYDYCSVTHHSANDWSKRQEDTTIITSDPSYQSVIGQMEGLSYGDVKLINKLYACSSACEKDLSCADNCYLNEHCKCYCPKKLSPGECELYTAVDQGPTEEEPLKNGVAPTTITPKPIMKVMPVTQEPDHNDISQPEQCQKWLMGTVLVKNVTAVDAIINATERAMELISSLTCVNFIPTTFEQENEPYVKIKQTNGFDCSSSQCMKNGDNEFNLSDKCRPLFGYALRGWLNILGISPEHLRSDRDDYISILANNIPETLVQLLGKHKNTLHEENYKDYDYCSITHYSSNVWSKTADNTTIETRDPSYQSVIGQMEGLSFGDIRLINKLYGCSDLCEPDLTCAENCYLNKDCKCYCPKRLSSGECELFTEANQKPTEEEPIKNPVVPMTMKLGPLKVTPTTQSENDTTQPEACHNWPEGVVLYKNATALDDDIWSASEQAMDLISSLTCVEFVPVEFDMDQPYVKLQQTMGFDCSSSQCMRKGSNEFKLSDKCAPLFGYALRGWLDTLGIYPQHLRSDRDDYISILSNDIPESLVHLFEKRNKTMLGDSFEEYDYCSVTHYTSNTWSKTQDGITIATSDPSYQSVIGQMDGLSFGDIKMINKMYGCSKNCPPNLMCEGNCYLNKDCKCFCPKNVSAGECELYAEPNEMPTVEEPIEKEVTTTEKQMTTTEKHMTTTEKQMTTTEKEITTTEKQMTTQKQMTTKETEMTTTDKPITTTEKQMTATETEMTTKKQMTTTETEMTTEKQMTTTEIEMTTEKQMTTAEKEMTTTEKQMTTTEKQMTTTEKQMSTTKAPIDDETTQPALPETAEPEAATTTMKVYPSGKSNIKVSSNKKTMKIVEQPMSNDIALPLTMESSEESIGDENMLSMIKSNKNLKEYHLITRWKKIDLKLPNKHKGKLLFIYANAMKQSHKHKLEFKLKEYDVGKKVSPCSVYFSYNMDGSSSFDDKEKFCGKMVNKKGINKKTITTAGNVQIEVTKDGKGGFLYIKGDVKIHK